MNKSKTYRLQIPERVAPCLTEWVKHPPFKGFQIDNMRLILSIISTHQRKDDNGQIYAQLKMEYLRNLVRSAGQYILFLKSSGIIERPGGYIPGEQSYRYRFTEAYQSPYIRSELKNPKLFRKIREVNTLVGRSDSRLYPKQKQQLKTMTIDYDAAMELIKKEYPGQKDVNRYNFAVGAVTRITNRESYFTKDDSGYRIHTPLTNLKSFLRSEIQINGKYISGLDIGNSQLYFSIKFLLNPESVKDFFPGNFPLMMAKCLRLTEQQDVAAFVLLVKEAKLYKFLESEFIKAGLKIQVVDDKKVSDATKKKIFTILFEQNHLTSRAKKIFQRYFPNVDKAFSLLRMVNYPDFVNCLARIESFAVNDLIIGRMNKEYPDMVAQQIYDNLVTSVATDDVVMAGKIMTEELTRFVGYPPPFRPTNFRPTADFNSFSSLKESKERKRGEGGGEGRPL